MNSKTEELKESMYSWLVSEIVVAEKHGVEVNVHGRKYSLKNMAELKEVMEDSYYMQSYTGDENGKIVRVDFEHIVSV